MDIFNIDKLDYYGRGLIKINDKVVFVKDTFIKDKVRIKIIEDKKNYQIAEVVEYIEKSPYRREFCKYQDLCGGCEIGCINYKEQLKYKYDKVKNLFDKEFNDYILNDIVYDNDIYYRNKIRLHVKNNKLGLYKKNTHELVEIDKCNLVNEKINDIIKRLNLFLINYDNNINSIVVKTTNNNQSMIVFYGEVNKDYVLKEFNDVDSIFINDLCLNNNFIIDSILDYKFYLSKDSFFQVNRFNTSKLYSVVFNYIKDKKYSKALDLYSGTGTIGICISKCVSSVVGIEVVKDAVVSANMNKDLNGVKNIEFINGKVEDYIDKFNNIDLVIVDPPRKGLDNKTKDYLKKINSKTIIYVSCDLMTLIRDVKDLSDNYILKEVTPVDMFPNTYHVESVCVLERK